MTARPQGRAFSCLEPIPMMSNLIRLARQAVGLIGIALFVASVLAIGLGPSGLVFR
jgi:hypothetical protein